MNLKRCCGLLVVLLCCAELPLFSQTSSTTSLTEKPYEFPQWAKDLRRADIIAFGVFPFAWFVSSLMLDLYRSAQHGWNDARYYPWPATSQNPVPWTNDEYITAIAATAALSISIAVVDFIIIKIKRNKAAARARELSPDAPVIHRTAPDSEIPADAESGASPPQTNGTAAEGGG